MIGQRTAADTTEAQTTPAGHTRLHRGLILRAVPTDSLHKESPPRRGRAHTPLAGEGPLTPPTALAEVSIALAGGVPALAVAEEGVSAAEGLPAAAMKAGEVREDFSSLPGSHNEQRCRVMLIRSGKSSIGCRYRRINIQKQFLLVPSGQR